MEANYRQECAMAKRLNDALNRIEGREATVCNNTCEYWKFPHLATACVLSDVFSVKKGELCFEYKPKTDNKCINEDG